MREYLRTYLNKSTYAYANQLKSLRRFFRDFLKRGDIVKSFKLPRNSFSPKKIPTKEQLREAYNSLGSKRQRAIFLLYATTGLRKNELRSVKLEAVDFEQRLIIPYHSTKTKNSWVSFFNQEAEANLKKYLDSRKDRSQRRIAISTKFKEICKQASKTPGTKITPQVLLEWFCSEMGRLGVPDRYVDAFCGRTPKSVLARHYMDYSPGKLKEIYEKANLKILE